MGNRMGVFVWEDRMNRSLGRRRSIMILIIMHWECVDGLAWRLARRAAGMQRSHTSYKDRRSSVVFSFQEVYISDKERGRY
jgi:hypothetical protein